MSPQPPKKLSIAEQGGIRAYLATNAHKHKGLDAADLLNRVELKVPWTKIAKDFGVSTETVKRWYRELAKDE